MSKFSRIGGFLKSPVVQGGTAICGAAIAGYVAIFPNSLKNLTTTPKTDIIFNAPVDNVNTGNVTIQKIENQVVNTIASDASLQALIGELKDDSQFFKGQILRLQKDQQVSALALISILRDVGKTNINDANALIKITEVIADYKQLQQQNIAVQGDSDKVIELKKQADGFFFNGQLDEAQKLYDQIEYAYTNDAINRAKAVAMLAQIAHARLLYLDEADYYRRAASLLPLDAENIKLRISHLRAEAGAFFQYGVDFADQDALFNAVDINQENITQIDKQQNPDDWAGNQQDIGNALSEYGALIADTATINDAIAAFQQALTIINITDHPKPWAATHNNIGLAYARLAGLSKHEPDYEQALTHYNQSLKVTKRSASPLAWAATQNNVASVYFDMFGLQNDEALLLKSIAAFQISLEERTFEIAPVGWANTKANIANVLTTHAMLKQDESLFLAAIDAYNAALKVHTIEYNSFLWATTQAKLGQTYMAYYQFFDDDELPRQAVIHLRAALSQLTKANAAPLWLASHAQLAAALSDIGQKSNDIKTLDESITVYRLTINQMSAQTTHINTQENWAYIQSGLGVTSFHLAKLQQANGLQQAAKTSAATARKAFDFSKIIYDELFPQQYDRYYADIYLEIDELVAKLNN